MTTDLDRLAAKRADALDRVAIATGDLRAAVVKAVASGMSEVEAARRAGVTRPTIRKWLGKDARHADNVGA